MELYQDWRVSLPGGEEWRYRGTLLSGFDGLGKPHGPGRLLKHGHELEGHFHDGQLSSCVFPLSLAEGTEEVSIDMQDAPPTVWYRGRSYAVQWTDTTKLLKSFSPLLTSNDVGRQVSHRPLLLDVTSEAPLSFVLDGVARTVTWVVAPSGGDDVIVCVTERGGGDVTLKSGAILKNPAKTPLPIQHLVCSFVEKSDELDKPAVHGIVRLMNRSTGEHYEFTNPFTTGTYSDSLQKIKYADKGSTSIEGGSRVKDAPFHFPGGCSGFYSGDLDVAGRQHGVGSIKWTDGSAYSGDWQCGSPSGRGTLRGSTGSKYCGQFRFGKADGEGVKYLRSGAMEYSGEWRGGMEHGNGIKYDVVGIADAEGRAWSEVYNTTGGWCQGRFDSGAAVPGSCRRYIVKHIAHPPSISSADFDVLISFEHAKWQQSDSFIELGSGCQGISAATIMSGCAYTSNLLLPLKEKRFRESPTLLVHRVSKTGLPNELTTEQAPSPDYLKAQQVRIATERNAELEKAHAEATVKPLSLRVSKPSRVMSLPQDCLTTFPSCSHPYGIHTRIIKGRVSVNLQGEWREVRWLGPPGPPSEHLFVEHVEPKINGVVTLSDGTAFEDPGPVFSRHLSAVSDREPTVSATVDSVFREGDQTVLLAKYHQHNEARFCPLDPVRVLNHDITFAVTSVKSRHSIEYTRWNPVNGPLRIDLGGVHAIHQVGIVIRQKGSSTPHCHFRLSVETLLLDQQESKCCTDEQVFTPEDHVWQEFAAATVMPSQFESSQSACICSLSPPCAALSRYVSIHFTIAEGVFTTTLPKSESVETISERNSSSATIQVRFRNENYEVHWRKVTSNRGPLQIKSVDPRLGGLVVLSDGSSFDNPPSRSPTQFKKEEDAHFLEVFQASVQTCVRDSKSQLAAGRLERHIQLGREKLERGHADH